MPVQVLNKQKQTLSWKRKQRYYYCKEDGLSYASKDY